MSVFVDVCSVDEVPNGKHRAFDIGDRSILIFRIDGAFHAIQNLCTHLNFALAGGRQIGCEIICPAHGARFDIRNGNAVGSPAVDPVPSYELRVADGMVQVRL